ncbi:hypothetical protein Vafri_11987 [Volvox africanus]|uniref:Uncharacterized protein n=1 Tax=Volvox africanus TaxID=51714 RepID=A0A8J4BDK8_9CHLO|nr:hypothetical protein Vafri_11987 [Volvox africanus]
MDSQQHNENILFTAPSPPAVAEDHARTSQAGAFVASSKRPLLMLSKPKRNERLGAAAAAAAAACGDGDGDDGDASVEPVLAACYLSPELSTSAANNARLITSILGAMPSLPGSPTLESAAVAREGASRLVLRSPEAASFRRCANATSGTFSGGRQTYHREINSSMITKSQSDRVVAVSRIRGGSGGCSPAYVDSVSAATLCSMRAIARKSVDAAEGAVTLATRQVSEISLAAAAAGAGEGYNEAGGGSEAAEDRAALPVSTDAAEAAPSARARASLNSSAAPPSSAPPSSPPPLPPPPQANVDVASRCNLPSVPQNRSGHGYSVNAVAPLLPLVSRYPVDIPSPFQVGPDPQSDRPRARCTSSAAAGGTYSGPAEEGCRGSGGGSGGSGGSGAGARSRELELRRRPRWLERLLRAFHSDRQSGGGSSTGSEEDSKESSSGGGGGGGDGGGGIGKMVAYRGAGGKPGGARGDVQPEDYDSGGGDGRDGRGGVGRARSCNIPTSGQDGVGAGTADPATVITPTSGRSTRDQFNRLLNSRLSHRSRSSSEELPLSVTASRDSTTIHRARLAQQARSSRATTPSINQQRGDGVVTTRSAGPRYGIVGANDFVTALTGKGGSDDGGSDGAAAAAAPAPVISASLTSFPYSASDVATSVTAAASAAAFDFTNRPIGRSAPRIRVSTPAGGMDVHTATPTIATAPATVAGRRGGQSSIARRLRQLSAPGGPEPQFTPLSRIEMHNLGCAEWADAAAAAIDERESEIVNEDLALRVTHRSAAMIFRR